MKCGMKNTCGIASSPFILTSVIAAEYAYLLLKDPANRDW